MSLGIRSNMWSVMAFETGTLLLAAVLFLPGLQAMFAVADLSVRQFAAVLVCAFVPTLVLQSAKMLAEAVS